MLTYPYTIKNPVTSTFSLAKLSPNRPYLLWWYAALVKGSESGQNNLQVLFREILDRTDTGLELGKIVKEILPLPLLGQYRIGSNARPFSRDAASHHRSRKPEGQVGQAAYARFGRPTAAYPKLSAPLPLRIFGIRQNASCANTTELIANPSRCS